jgi:UDP-N-acetylglucosamine 4-epimerase
MMNRYEQVKEELKARPRTWLVTGVAGFIGSNLLEHLLRLDQRVIGLDNFATGYRHNLEEVRSFVESHQWERFCFMEGDIRDLDSCKRACVVVDYVLHQAALGSVPRSLADPLASHRANVDGFVNMLVAAREAKVRRVVYAASSSTYGDHPGLPKVEDVIGKPLSPYAVTKYVNELYADVFARSDQMQAIGLRYFNVFGPRQDPHGAYAAVIPRWLDAMLSGAPVYINGDGESSRDFCFVENAVRANLLAATAPLPSPAEHHVLNVAVGERTSLLQLFGYLRAEVARHAPEHAIPDPLHREFRAGDARHSLADISRAHALIGYEPTHDIRQGLRVLADWFVARRPSGH